jgi:hypothetical protein
VGEVKWKIPAGGRDFYLYFHYTGVEIVIGLNFFWCKWLGENELLEAGDLFCLTRDLLVFLRVGVGNTMMRWGLVE